MAGVQVALDLVLLALGQVAILLYRSTMPLLTLMPSSSNSLPCFSNASLENAHAVAEHDGVGHFIIVA